MAAAAAAAGTAAARLAAELPEWVSPAHRQALVAAAAGDTLAAVRAALDVEFAGAELWRMAGSFLAAAVSHRTIIIMSMK